MADEKPPVGAEDNATTTITTAHHLTADELVQRNVEDGGVDRPKGWMYKGYTVRGKTFWYASPKVQLLMISFVCFLCPGMYNSLTGLGGGGQIDQTASTNANTALNAVFSVVAFFAGTVANRLGLRLTIAFGGLGYCVYSASFLCYSHTQNSGFVIFAGAFLGLCAGLLWTAQGAIMMSYPTEKNKGRYISWFWIIFNLGAVIGSLIPLAQNVNRTAGNVTDGTYIAFIILMALGACIGMLLCNADKVVREDGTKVILMKNPSWKTEFIGLYETLAADPMVILLFPMFFSSNIFYTYQTNDMNGAHFNTRTRALNNLLYWLAQIVGAVILGYALDYPGIRRSLRAKLALGMLGVLTMVIWGGGWAWQEKQVTREVAENADVYEDLRVDWTDGGKRYVGPMFLYFFYGLFDAAWQTCIYWYMGALSNSGRKAANYAGFYKGIQSGGAAVFWRLDGTGRSYNLLFGLTWGMLAFSLLSAAPVVWLRIKDTVPIEEDLKFSDETVEDVILGLEKKEGDEKI